MDTNNNISWQSCAIVGFASCFTRYCSTLAVDERRTYGRYNDKEGY